MSTEKTSLPFEVAYSDMPGKKSKSMKRLAVLLKPENVRDVISLFNELNLEATIYDVKGVTKGMERVASGRGSTTSELSYNSRKVLATVINSEHVEELVRRMKNALAGNKAVVMVSNVEDLIMI